MQEALQNHPFTQKIGYIPVAIPIDSVTMPRLSIHNRAYIEANEISLPFAALPLDYDLRRLRWVPFDGPDEVNEVTIASIPERVPVESALTNFPEFRKKYGIPNTIELHEVSHLRGIPRHPSGFIICEGFLVAGMKLPLDPLTVRVLNHYGLAPAQMSFIFYRIMSFLNHLNEAPHNYGVSVEDVAAGFIYKTCDRMPMKAVNIWNGTPTFSLSRRRGQGLFQPPSNDHFKIGRIFEVYGDIYKNDDKGRTIGLTHTNSQDAGEFYINSPLF